MHLSLPWFGSGLNLCFVMWMCVDFFSSILLCFFFLILLCVCVYSAFYSQFVKHNLDCSCELSAGIYATGTFKALAQAIRRRVLCTRILLFEIRFFVNDYLKRDEREKNLICGTTHGAFFVFCTLKSSQFFYTLTFCTLNFSWFYSRFRRSTKVNILKKKIIIIIM